MADDVVAQERGVVIDFPQVKVDRQKFVINQQGKDHVLFSGLVDALHQLSGGFFSVDTRIEQLPTAENGQTAVCSARVQVFDPDQPDVVRRSASGIGDASPANVNRMMATALIRMAECVPLRAEMLTRNGWKHHSDLRVHDEVLAYNHRDDRCEWLPLLAINVFTEVDEPLVHLSSRSFRATVTPDHKWAVANGMFTGLRKTNELRRGDRIFVAARAESGEHEMPPRDAAILGWALTDGTIRSDRGYPRIHIDQSKPDYVAEIRELLGPDATESVTPAGERTFPTGKTYATKPGHRFSLNAKLTRRLLASQPISDFIRLALPSLVTRLSRESRAAMLDAMLKGDGSGRDGRRWVFGKKQKPGVMEAFEILATLEGRALGVPRISSGPAAIPVRSIREDRMVATGYLKRTEVAPEPVWCPTTFWGTWVMRLDGCITITGNTRAKARALRDLCNVGMVSFEELGQEEAPERREEPKPSFPVRDTSRDPAPPQVEGIVIEGRRFTRPQVETAWRLRRAEAERLGIALPPQLREVVPERTPLPALAGHTQEVRRLVEATQAGQR